MTDNFDRSASPVISVVHLLMFMAAAGFVGWVLYRIALFFGLNRWLREPSFGLDGYLLGLCFLLLVVSPPLGIAFSYQHIHGAADVIGCLLVAVLCPVFGFFVLRRETVAYIIRLAAELTAYQEQTSGQNQDQGRQGAETRPDVG